MSEAVTFDTYSLQVHKDYADRLIQQDSLFSEGAHSPAHLQGLATGEVIPEEWKKLFEVHDQLHPFSFFEAPEGYYKQLNRFFKTCALVDSIDWDQEKNPKEQVQSQTYTYTDPLSLFEKDQAALLKVVETIIQINDWLKEGCGRQSQYQQA